MATRPCVSRVHSTLSGSMESDSRAVASEKHMFNGGLVFDREAIVYQKRKCENSSC